MNRFARLFPRRWMFVAWALIGQALLCGTLYATPLSWVPFFVFVAVWVFPVALGAAVLDFFGG